jgi:SET domain-containing protein
MTTGILSDIIIEDDNGPHTQVKASFIHGWGLFATKQFHIGETVIDYNLFPESWYETRYAMLTPEQISYNWYVMLDRERCITSDRWSKFSYINHSRRPNCDWFLDKKLIVAHRNIEIGEELFIDYRLEPQPKSTFTPNWL